MRSYKNSLCESAKTTMRDAIDAILSREVKDFINMQRYERMAKRNAYQFGAINGSSRLLSSGLSFKIPNCAGYVLILVL
jgi:hypothetical protein